MDDKELMNAFKKQLSEGLKSGDFKIDDIEHIVGDTLEQFKKELLAQTQEVIEQSEPAVGMEECPDCSRTLKKTKEKLSP